MVKFYLSSNITLIKLSETSIWPFLYKCSHITWCKSSFFSFVSIILCWGKFPKSGIKFFKKKVGLTKIIYFNKQPIHSDFTLSMTFPILEMDPWRSLCLSEYFLTRSRICSLHCWTYAIEVTFKAWSFSSGFFQFYYLSLKIWKNK